MHIDTISYKQGTVNSPYPSQRKPKDVKPLLVPQLLSASKAPKSQSLSEPYTA